MADFVGRATELERLEDQLDRVRSSGQGLLVAIRGRRQVGKSTLVERFLQNNADTPAVFFAAARGALARDEVARFAREVASSSLEAAAVFADVSVGGWEAAFRLLASTMTRPSVVVIDELPYLLEGDCALEGLLQAAWDRSLSKAPLLLVVVGSDLAMMELLSSHGRPLFGRVRELVLEPLTVADTAVLLGLGAVEAFDAHLVTGGFPRVAGEWRGGMTLDSFLREQLQESTSPLVVVGERVLEAEFHPGLQARSALLAIGSGQRTFSGIADRAGLDEGSLTRTLGVLVQAKRVVRVDRPLSARASRETRYQVADHYLRFWLRFVAPGLQRILRGAGAQVADEVGRRWSDYRGGAVEPLVRTCVERLLPDPRFGDAVHVGAYWTRRGDVEVDLVGSSRDRAPAPVAFVGSVKWRSGRPFQRRDLADLAVQRARVPGASDALLVGVSTSGFDTTELDVALGPEDLLAAWHPDRSRS